MGHKSCPHRILVSGLMVRYECLFEYLCECWIQISEPVLFD